MITTTELKVLVINGALSIRKLLRSDLSAKRYQIIETPNAKTALELLNQCPDLVIIDIDLADIQEHELLRIIRSPNKYITIAALSGCDEEADKVQAIDLGPNDYVTKPFGMEKLSTMVRAALRRESRIIQGERITNAAMSEKKILPFAPGG